MERVLIGAIVLHDPAVDEQTKRAERRDRESARPIERARRAVPHDHRSPRGEQEPDQRRANDHELHGFGLSQRVQARIGAPPSSAIASNRARLRVGRSSSMP
jgi:hypothetical protein